ncbi:TIGR02206 family membrane protein [Ornithinibacillus salinisoli]|uniref:TIGR02206 family membrane protein n=1 Tax=Ornithinibacillus salinisoli TaxID=1848459 RepID=A0ABW4VYJ5_9BACI
MQSWFGKTTDITFEVFEMNHIIMISIHVIGSLLLFNLGKRLSSRTQHFIRWGLLCTLILSEISYQVWGIYNGAWNPREFLPFQLCSIAGIIAMFALYSKNIKLIQLLFFIGIIPSILTVLTPELHHGFPHFRFWQFFIHHIVLTWASIFLTISFNVRISLIITIEIYIYLLVYAGFIGFLINPIFNANYLFLANTPRANTPLGLLGSGLSYYVNLCLIGLGVFLLLFVFYKLFVRLIK